MSNFSGSPHSVEAFLWLLFFWLIKLSEERLRVGELARVIDEVASLVEEWRLGEAVHMSLHLRVSLLFTYIVKIVKIVNCQNRFHNPLKIVL